MSWQPVSPGWFDHIPGGARRDQYDWLAQLSESVDRIANFGCWSNEPFAILWTLDAEKIVVVEKDPAQLDKEDGPRANLDFLMKNVPSSLQGRQVKFVVADMTSKVAGLSSDCFDLAFCEDVLYFMDDDMSLVQSAINEMARVVKPGGWVIAVEPKIGVQFKHVTQKLFGCQMERLVPVGAPINISHLFHAAGLLRTEIAGAPEWSYCYRKPAAED